MEYEKIISDNERIYLESINLDQKMSCNSFNELLFHPKVVHLIGSQSIFNKNVTEQDLKVGVNKERAITFSRMKA